MTHEESIKFNEQVLNTLTEKGSKVFCWHNSKRNVTYKLILTKDGIEIRRATSKREYPDTEGYKWFVAGDPTLETVEKAIEVAHEDFKNKRNGNRANSRLGNKLYRDPRTSVGIFEVVYKLRQILNGINIVMRRR